MKIRNLITLFPSETAVTFEMKMNFFDLMGYICNFSILITLKALIISFSKISLTVTGAKQLR
jgi:hypothetical protein